MKYALLDMIFLGNDVGLSSIFPKTSSLSHRYQQIAQTQTAERSRVFVKLITLLPCVSCSELCPKKVPSLCCIATKTIQGSTSGNVSLEIGRAHV